MLTIISTSKFLGEEVERFSLIIPSIFSIKENISQNTHIHDYIDTYVTDEVFPQPACEPLQRGVLTIHRLGNAVVVEDLIRDIDANREPTEYQNDLTLRCFYEKFIAEQKNRRMFLSAHGPYVDEHSVPCKFFYPKEGYKPTVVIPVISNPLEGSKPRFMFFTYGDKEYNIHTREIDYNLSHVENTYVALLSKELVAA